MQPNIVKAKEIENQQKQNVIQYIHNKYRINYNDAEKIVEQAYIHGNKHNIEPSLIIGIIEHESAFKKNIVSKANAVGLMQIVPKYHRQRIANITNKNNQTIQHIETNIELGTNILKDYINRYSNIGRALQAYNGSHNSNRYSRVVFRKQNNIENIMKNL